MTPKKLNPQKESAVSDLAANMSSAKSVVFIDYTGLQVKPQQELKRRLKDSGADFKVAKNTLIKLAGQNASLPFPEDSDNIFSGQLAVVFANDDSVAPIQTLGKFMSENELPKFKAGIVEGSFQDDAALLKISKLPGRDALTAQALGAISAPLYSFVGTLQGNLQKLIFILNAKAQTQN
jgi:large subunit ribosomal protein L10